MGNLRRQLLWLIIFRLVVSTTLLLSFVFLQAVAPRAAWPLKPFFLLLLAPYACSGLFLAFFRLGVPDKANAYVQFLGDVSVVSGLLYITGGLFSPFTILYYVVVIVAATLLYRQGALIVASLAFVGYGAIVAMTYWHFLPPHPGLQEERRYLLLSIRESYFWLFLNMFGLYAVAYLTSRLSENLRREGSRAERSAFRVRELEAFHRSLVESMTVGLLTTDDEGTISFASSSTELLLGRKASEIEGRTIDGELLGADGFSRSRLALSRQRQHRVEVVRSGPEGESQQLAVTASRLGGPVAGYLFLVEDLTDLKRLEEELRLKDRMAALGEMAAGLAHEIRNPLASMTGSVEVLGKDLDLDGDHERLVGIVLKESRRLDGIIRDFLDYARPRPLEIQEIDLSELARETLDLFRHSAEVGEGLEVVLEGPGHVHCEGDPNQLRQVVWNLVRNAKEAMPEGGRLVVGVFPDGERVRLTVRDTGMGMSEEERRAAVQPFHSESRRGVGLGLTIVYRIIRDHGGEIRIWSRKGRGTEVTVHLNARLPARTKGTPDAVAGAREVGT